MKENGTMTPEQITALVESITQMKAGFTDLQKLPEGFKSIQDVTKALQEQNDKLTEQVNALRKSALDQRNAADQGLAARLAANPQLHGFSQEACRYLGAIAVAQAAATGKSNSWESGTREKLFGQAKDVLGLSAGVEIKTALASTDIVLPTQYASQITELVYKYGVARKVATYYPLGATTVKLPRLKTDPTFGFIAVSGSVTEKVPQIEWVTFTPGKAGGIVRIPSEIDADSIVPLGAFVGRYVARQLAQLEDLCLFASDGTSTYNSITGMGKQSDNDSYTLTLATTNTHPSDITLANLRALRAKPTGAVLGDSKYYMHMTMEALLVSFNTSATVTPYIRNADGTATLDGFPIIWVPSMPVYTTSATVSAYQVFFGDASYWYFGERMGMDVQTSRDVYFATDEIGIRALERFDIQQMGKQATAALKLAAS